MENPINPLFNVHEKYKEVNLINPYRFGVPNTPPAVISDGNTVAWYDSTDLTVITKDVNDYVNIWWDKVYGQSTLEAELNSLNTTLYNVYKITACQTDFFYTGCAVNDIWFCDNNKVLSSNNKVRRYTGNHCGTYTLADKPKWVLNDGLLFDGSNDKLYTPTFTYNQPAFIYMVLKQVTWTVATYFFDGNADTGLVYQQTSSPKIRAYSGSLSSENSDMPLDTFVILRVLFNGASSKLQVNNSTATTGNFGSNNMGRIILGSRVTGQYSNIKIKEAIFRKVADNSTDETSIYNYLATKYGFATI
jgi:hypothetical protein